MKKKTGGLLIKFASLFLVFSVVMIFVAGVNTFFIQQNIIYEQMNAYADSVATHLADTISVDYQRMGLEAEDYVEENVNRVKSDFKLKDVFFVKEKAEDYSIHYRPVVVNGITKGYVGVVLEDGYIDGVIADNSKKFTVGVAIATVIMMAFLLLYVYFFHIKRLIDLKEKLEIYTKEKDPKIAQEIEKSVKDVDEIASLSMQSSALILELDNYMKNMMEIKEELTDTKKQAEALSDLSKKDALTGVRNKVAYDHEIEKLNEDIKNPDARFGIVVVDINNLRVINETIGHEKGNEVIRTVCHIICEVFRHSPVFRIGANEFAVILKNEDYYEQNDLAKRLLFDIEKEEISAAAGVALYSPAIDMNAKDVFTRAENAMMSRKKEMR